MNLLDGIRIWMRELTGRPVSGVDGGLRMLAVRLAGAVDDTDRATVLAATARAVQWQATTWRGSNAGGWRQGQMLWALADVYFQRAGFGPIRVQYLQPFSDGTRQTLKAMAATADRPHLAAASDVLATLGPEDPARSAIIALQQSLTAPAPAPASTPVTVAPEVPGPVASGTAANPPPAAAFLPLTRVAPGAAACAALPRPMSPDRTGRPRQGR